TAYVYVRQSTPEQVLHNRESQLRQYALADRARSLGWSDVVVVDEDQGRSGAGTARPGFKRMLGAICEGSVGAVLAVEASRLSRNGRDWHTLLEYSGFVGCLIIDEDGIYDPQRLDDRWMLGLKGTMSEMEHSSIRRRMDAGLLQKAQRGELFGMVAIGYVKVGQTRIEKDPDRRVQEALELVFRKFTELGSIRQVLLWLREEKIELPALVPGPDGLQKQWKLPVNHTIRHILTNPVYAGAYAFGRTTTRTRLVEGRKVVVHGVRRAEAEWTVLLHDRHQGYISWAEFERNQQTIADNATMKGELARGPIRKGEALLAGLLRCGHCGRKLNVIYTGKGGNTIRYQCRGAEPASGGGKCIRLGALRIDRGVGAEVVRQIQPLGIEAALAAIDHRAEQAAEVRRQVDLALEQARYEAERARRQYDAIDPANRLVAAELERRWNERLVAVNDLERRLDSRETQAAPSLTSADKDRLLALGADVERAWNHPAATPETRKRILRTVLKEVVAQVDGDQVILTLHWQGGDHSQISVKRNRSGHHRWVTDVETGDLIRQLARTHNDKTIATVLNQAGKTTGHGNSWNEARVRSFRGKHSIAIYRPGERAERGELTLSEVMERLSLNESVVLRMLYSGELPGRQACKGAPWIIPEQALEKIA
ncbi:recombinase family protein, partial [Propionivibrio sp.]|uniref:recombinase family protein n=1 Tax=Propionivibrio sp. TaxID=2212460 RepID=UPI003BF0E3D4